MVVFPQFFSFEQNNSVETSMLIFFTSRHYSFFEKLKIVEKQLCKLNCSDGKDSHTLNELQKLINFVCFSILANTIIFQL